MVTTRWVRGYVRWKSSGMDACMGAWREWMDGLGGSIRGSGARLGEYTVAA